MSWTSHFQVAFQTIPKKFSTSDIRVLKLVCKSFYTTWNQILQTTNLAKKSSESKDYYTFLLPFFENVKLKITEEQWEKHTPTNLANLIYITKDQYIVTGLDDSILHWLTTKDLNWIASFECDKDRLAKDWVGTNPFPSYENNYHRNGWPHPGQYQKDNALHTIIKCLLKSQGIPSSMYLSAFCWSLEQKMSYKNRIIFYLLLFWLEMRGWVSKNNDNRFLLIELLDKEFKSCVFQFQACEYFAFWPTTKPWPVCDLKYTFPIYQKITPNNNMSDNQHKR